MNPAIAGRPDILGDRMSLTLYPGMEGMLENTFMNVKNRSKMITAKVEIPKGGANGVILSQGGRFGGWSLYMKDGKPVYTYNYLGLERYTVASNSVISAGDATFYWTSFTMVVDSAKAVWRLSLLTGKPSQRVESRRPSP